MGRFLKSSKKKETFEFSQDENTLVNILGQNIFNGLKQKRLSLCLNLNLSNFQRQWQEINDLLTEEKLFLKVYEQKNKFHYLIKKGPQKSIIQKDLLACVEEQFNGFETVRKLSLNQMKNDYKPLNIIYKPVASSEQPVDCYFTSCMRNTYRVVRSNLE